MVSLFRSSCAASLVLSATVAAQAPTVPPAGERLFGQTGWVSNAGPVRAVGDLNVDGYPDLVAAFFGIQVALNNGHGVFVEQPVLASVASTKMVAADVGDMNGDGWPDVVAVGPYSGGFVGVFLGDGDGGLALGATFAIDDVVTVAVLDLDADDDLDIVTGVAPEFGSGGGLRLLHNDGSGGFSGPVVWGPLTDCYSVLAADFDGDGDEDVVANISTSGIYFLRVDGTGTLVQQAAVFGGGAHLAAGDVNADGVLDYVGVRDTASDRVMLHRSINGSVPGSTRLYNTGGYAATLVDLADDGLPEIAVASGGVTLSVIGNTTGIPQLPPTTLAVGGTGLIFTADMDGDGFDDVVTSDDRSADPHAAVLFNEGTGTLSIPPRVTFTHQTPQPLPRAARFADLDADGNPEILIGDSGSGELLVSAGNGTANYGAWSAVPSESVLFSLEPVDIDADGNLDILCAAWSGNGLLESDIVVHLGDGTGALGAPLKTSFFSFAGDAEAGDFNGDGILDTALLTFGPDLAGIWRGDGSGLFTPEVTVPVVEGNGALAVLDANLDGNLDIASASDDLLVVLYGDGNGRLSHPFTVSSGNGTRRSVDAADFDGDGFVDLVTGALNAAGTVALHRGTGTESFAPPIHGGPKGNAGVYAADTSVVDVDGDGNLDVVAGMGIAASFTVVPGDGAGGFGPELSFPCASGPVAIDTADVNGDGRLDVVVLGTVERAVSVHLNQGRENSWISVGGGVSGAGGTPRARGTGEPLPGETITIRSENNAPLAPGILIVGSDLLGFPTFPGLIVPTVDYVRGASTNAFGTYTLNYAWQPTSPTGVDLWFQHWTADPAANNGASATGGLRLRVP